MSTPATDYWDRPENVEWMRARFRRTRPDWEIRRADGLWWADHRHTGETRFSANVMTLDRYMSIYDEERQRYRAPLRGRR
ncbi:hypothetical protein [Nonomuraea basaltis]|uniref:hypothetical protein n=1 Tax=Nonomuraea basaltis TaxID=2495887 RepID=UPI00110C677D|nr:hypothetical protein [Nonomuraea basaltis]TMR94334.1 hypothetical protein EJK15_34205 [Nonomuraea basaltis]